MVMFADRRPAGSVLPLLRSLGVCTRLLKITVQHPLGVTGDSAKVLAVKTGGKGGPSWKFSLDKNSCHLPGNEQTSGCIQKKERKKLLRSQRNLVKTVYFFKSASESPHVVFYSNI